MGRKKYNIQRDLKGKEPSENTVNKGRKAGDFKTIKRRRAD